jgi:hypothetical protein
VALEGIQGQCPGESLSRLATPYHHRPAAPPHRQSSKHPTRGGPPWLSSKKPVCLTYAKSSLGGLDTKPLNDVAFTRLGVQAGCRPSGREQVMGSQIHRDTVARCEMKEETTWPAHRFRPISSTRHAAPSLATRRRSAEVSKHDPILRLLSLVHGASYRI